MVHSHSSWSTFGLHLVRLCRFIFLRYQTMEVGPSSRTKEKCHLPWFDSMVHNVNRPSVWNVISFLALISMHGCEIYSPYDWNFLKLRFNSLYTICPNLNTPIFNLTSLHTKGHFTPGGWGQFPLRLIA